MAKRVGRYGMAHHTIVYFQHAAITLYRYNGIYGERGRIETHWRSMTARDLAHAVIGLAAVASPEQVRAVLSGTRGRRWNV